MTGGSDGSECVVTFDPKVPCLTMSWNGYFTSQRFREANERVLDAVRQAAATKLLGDITNFTLIGAEDQRWLTENWIPRLIAAGVRHVALVQPVFYFNVVAVQSVVDKVSQDQLLVRIFDSVPSARRWLWETGAAGDLATVT
ncbi:hypothetical protein [Arenibaculum pallidiluteum]|uniref:hypothetical protein n=1 Tax=Arenibaculum pallidiluteum TaxID=2812559 RepID=UPI001A966DDF|nr:hypothetical protein [Arenibaculum pallidiluteum]